MRSSPPPALRSSRSAVPMSRLKGPGGVGPVRSNAIRPAVVEGATVNTSPPPPPLTSMVSLPAPPSLVSSPSPGFQTSVSSPSPPTELSRVPAGLLSPLMRSLPAPPVIRSAPSPPSSVSLSVAAVDVEREADAGAWRSWRSSPPPALRSSRSALPMSRLKGPGGVGPVRSNAIRPAVAEGATVNTSPPPPPLTSIVSVSEPPSLMSSPSPGFQTSVSRPEPPTELSRVPAGLLSPMMRSSSSPPNRLSSMSLPVIVSSPAPPSTSTSVTSGNTAPGSPRSRRPGRSRWPPGPPVTSIVVMLAQSAAGPGSGSAPLTFTVAADTGDRDRVGRVTGHGQDTAVEVRVDRGARDAREGQQRQTPPKRRARPRFGTVRLNGAWAWCRTSLIDALSCPCSCAWVRRARAVVVKAFLYPGRIGRVNPSGPSSCAAVMSRTPSVSTEGVARPGPP